MWRWRSARLFIAERRRPLRRQKEPGPERVGRNLTIGLLAGATTAAAEMPIVAPVQRLAERRRLGLLRQIPMPRALRVVLGFLLLDYTLYPVAPAEPPRRPACGASTPCTTSIAISIRPPALRFHVGELAMASGFRALQVLLLGVDRETLRLWQQIAARCRSCFTTATWNCPIAVEQRLNTVS